MLHLSDRIVFFLGFITDHKDLISIFDFSHLVLDKLLEFDSSVYRDLKARG